MFLLTVATIWAMAAITPGANVLVVVRCALTRASVLAAYQRARRALDMAAGVVFVGFGARLMLAER